MTVTDLRWQSHFLATFFVVDYFLNVGNILNRSVRSQTCHQNISSKISVANIDVTDNVSFEVLLDQFSYRSTLIIFSICISIDLALIA